MDIFMINTDIDGGRDLAIKLSGSQDGSILELTTEEMNLARSEDFMHIHTSGSRKSAIEMDPNKSYIFLCDPARTNIFDLEVALNVLDINAAIVRITNV